MTKSTAKTFGVIQGAALIQKAITSIQTRGGKLDHDIHVAGVSVLAHAAAHGDSTLADKLVQAMPKGARKLALVEWMLAYGQVSLLDKVADREAVQAGRVFKIDRTKRYDEAGAIAESWTEFKPERDPLTAFDAQAAVSAVLGRLTKAQKSHLTIKNRAEALAQAQALVAALSAEYAEPQEAPM